MDIKLENVTKNYGKAIILHHIDLEIKAGQMVAIVGPSGCGKSTLLRLLAGFLQPDSGQILFGGQSVAHLPPEKRPTSLVFQSYALWPHKTVFDNVAFGLRVRHWKKEEISNRVAEMLKLVELGQLAHRYPGELSGGQQQRVALARSLAVSPAILLLDEPLSNLDAQVRVQMRTELRLLQQRLGITTLYVTHDQEEALSVADKVVVMQKGLIEQFAAPLTIYNAPASPFVAKFIGRSNLLSGQVAGLDTKNIEIALTPLLTRQTLPTNQFTITVPIRNWRSPLPLKVGQKLVVAIKPEQITLSLFQSGSPLMLTAKIVSLTFIGSMQEIAVANEYGSIQVLTTASNQIYQPGQLIEIYLDSANLLLFPD